MEHTLARATIQITEIKYALLPDSLFHSSFALLLPQRLPSAPHLIVDHAVSCTVALRPKPQVTRSRQPVALGRPPLRLIAQPIMSDNVFNNAQDAPFDWDLFLENDVDFTFDLDAWNDPTLPDPHLFDADQSG